MMSQGFDEVTIADVERCDWEASIAASSEKECFHYTGIFTAKAHAAVEAGDTSGARVYTLLASITSLHVGEDKAQPYGPAMVFRTWRSFSIDDLTPTLLDLFKHIAPRVVDAEMRARLADIVWVRAREHRLARLAVDAYLESARILEDPEEWVLGFQKIERALHLAASLGARERTKVVARIEEVLISYNGEDPLFLSAELMRLLLEYRAGDPTTYAALADKAARRAETARDWHRARTYLDLAARWHARGKDPDQERAMRLREADAYVHEAQDARTGGGTAPYGRSVHFLRSAIEAFRRIPGTDERREQIHKQMLQDQRTSVAELKRFSSSIDVSALTDAAVARVRDKPFHEAILTLTMLRSSPNVSELARQVDDAMAGSPLPYLFSTVMLNENGKVVAQRPTMEADGSNGREAAKRAEMFQQAASQHQVMAGGVIVPIKDYIVQHHPVRVQDFFPIVSNNIFVPSGREMIYARGLYAGLTDDWLVAAHLLIPQVEHSIRVLLEEQGVVTSGLDKNGIQNEYDLNRTLYMPELATIFDEDIVFDLRGLLVEHYGSNLRNLMAHGLLNHDAFYSRPIVYLWWLVLRLCCIPIIAGRHEDARTEDGSPSNESE